MVDLHVYMTIRGYVLLVSVLCVCGANRSECLRCREAGCCRVLGGEVKGLTLGMAELGIGDVLQLFFDLQHVEIFRCHTNTVHFFENTTLPRRKNTLVDMVIEHDRSRLPAVDADTRMISGSDVDTLQPSSQPHVNDDFDDIFGSAPSSPSALSHDHRNQDEPSEIPRLRSAHSAAGYRDGIATAKASKIQEGFDEGYSLGAVIGLRAGKILGILEGIYSAIVKINGNSSEPDVARLKKLVELARSELCMQQIYQKELWGADGIWSFEVHGDEDGTVTFADVASAHPAIQKWTAISETEVDRWGLKLGVLADEEDQKQNREV